RTKGLTRNATAATNDAAASVAIARPMPAQSGPLVLAMALTEVPAVTCSVMNEYPTMKVPSATRIAPTSRTRANQKAPTSQTIAAATAAKVASSEFTVAQMTRLRLSW